MAGDKRDSIQQSDRSCDTPLTSESMNGAVQRIRTLILLTAGPF